MVFKTKSGHPLNHEIIGSFRKRSCHVLWTRKIGRWRRRFENKKYIEIQICSFDVFHFCSLTKITFSFFAWFIFMIFTLSNIFSWFVALIKHGFECLLIWREHELVITYYFRYNFHLTRLRCVMIDFTTNDFITIRTWSPLTS